MLASVFEECSSHSWSSKIKAGPSIFARRTSVRASTTLARVVPKSVCALQCFDFKSYFFVWWESWVKAGGNVLDAGLIRGTEAASTAEAERRPLSVMFCDLVGSTALSSRLDPEDLREVIRTSQACVATTIRQYDGFIARYVGDGVLIYFGWPEARETDAERAVRAGLAPTIETFRSEDAAWSGLPRPQRPSCRADQNASTEWPSAETQPAPVTTIGSCSTAASFKT